MPRPSFPFARQDDAASAHAAGIWSLAPDGGLVEVERFDVGPAIVLVPGEQVLLLTAALPVAGRRRRAAALPFAIEDRIAAPLTEVHAALGEETAPGHHLAAVVADATMRDWIATIDGAGLGHAAMVPDMLALPVPPAGAWSVDAGTARALVRTEDGAGFTVPLAAIEQAWRLGGEPAVTAYGLPLPFSRAADMAELAPAPLAERLARPALDLRQGAYAGLRRAQSPLLRRVLAIAAIGVVAHGAIAAAGTLALDRLAATRAGETRALIAQVAPGAAIGDDLVTGAAEILPANGAGSSSFLPLLARVATALRPLVPGIAMRSIAFDAAADSLSIEVEAADIAGLQRVGAAFAAAHVSAQAGTASQDQGKAVGAFLIRGGSAGAAPVSGAGA